MRIEDIHADGWTAEPTPVPTKTMIVYDWAALYETIQAQGFVVIESDQLRKTPSGGAESVLVKGFVTYVHNLKQTPRVKLVSRRIGVNRWYCALQPK
jgi:hypothetical protein